VRALLFVNGTIADYAALEALLLPDDYLIAVDAGTRHCLVIGRMPDAVIGDLDSVDASTLAELRAQSVHIERHPPTKNETDLELALAYAFTVAEHKPIRELLLVGMLGGRLDQMLGNVLILAQRDWPLPLIIVDGTMRAQVVSPNAPLTLQAAVGDTVSALPLSETVTGITYHGMRYPLENHTLQLGSTRGISNEVIEVPATVQIGTGKLLIVERAQ